MPTTYSKTLSYNEIRDYWTKNPCSGGNPEFPFCSCKGKKVLEIGCGSGMDAKRFVNAEAIYTGIDLTTLAVAITKSKIMDKGQVHHMNAESMDFPDEYFDVVYSWGVIHHALDQKKIYKEIYRVLKPRGIIFIMLYNKPSIRYNLDIMFLRNITKWFHSRLRPYRKLSKKDWISANTDTLGCPKADVYTEKEARDFLYQYSELKTYTVNWGWFRVLWGIK